MRIGMIWAQARGGVIGEAGDMPWSLPEDMARFKAITTGHPVVMGRRTWESFPARFRPLPGRANIVITTDASYEAPGAQVVGGLEDALVLAGRLAEGGDAWIIGGYPQLMERQRLIDRMDAREVFIDTPKEICEARARERNGKWPFYVADWWGKFQPTLPRVA